MVNFMCQLMLYLRKATRGECPRRLVEAAIELRYSYSAAATSAGDGYHTTRVPRLPRQGSTGTRVLGGLVEVRIRRWR